VAQYANFRNMPISTVMSHTGGRDRVKVVGIITAR
jgi:hypothetical protein